MLCVSDGGIAHRHNDDLTMVYLLVVLFSVPLNGRQPLRSDLTYADRQCKRSKGLNLYFIRPRTATLLAMRLVCKPSRSRWGMQGQLMCLRFPVHNQVRILEKVVVLLKYKKEGHNCCMCDLPVPLFLFSSHGLKHVSKIRTLHFALAS